MTSPSEICIESTKTDPVVRAQSVLQQTNQRLQGRLATLTEIDPAGEPVGTAVADLDTGELRCCPSACDQTLCAAVAGAAEPRLLVRALCTTASVVRQHNRQAVLGRQCSLRCRDRAGHRGCPACASRGGAERVAAGPHPPSLVPTCPLWSRIWSRRSAAADWRVRRSSTYARSRPASGIRGSSSASPGRHRGTPSSWSTTTTPSRCAASWEYVESGPEQWEVRIGRQAGLDD